jgi:four helix bundle protein
MRDQRKLLVTKLARDLAIAVYRLTATFPDDERYGLAAQMRRAAVSVGSNIAEGAGRYGDREFLRFVHIAYASASELAFQLTLAEDLGFGAGVEHARMAEAIDLVQRMLNRLATHLRPNRAAGPTVRAPQLRRSAT